MSFLTTIVSVAADVVADKVIEKLDAYYSRLGSFSEKANKKDQKALEVKEQIKLAQTDEERDVLLDKLDEIIRSNIDFK